MYVLLKCNNSLLQYNCIVKINGHLLYTISVLSINLVRINDNKLNKINKKILNYLIEIFPANFR